MRAYLNGDEYQDERINKRDFQQCFRMVTQAVKGLGLPSDQRVTANEAIIEEVAAAIRDTQEIVGLAASPGDETEH